MFPSWKLYLSIAYFLFISSLEIRRLQQDARDHFKHIVSEHEKVKLQIEDQKKELQQREHQLLDREAQNDNERRKLHKEKKMVLKLLFRLVLKSFLRIICVLQFLSFTLQRCVFCRSICNLDLKGQAVNFEILHDI